MKLRIAAVVVVLAVIAVLVIFKPFPHPSLEHATVKLMPTTQAPAGHDDVLAVFYSGDGGWRDLDKQLGQRLVARGVPVLGISCLDYYWRMRSADESAKDLDALITQYTSQWHKQKVWLIGFSFGADVLPTIVNKLSPANRARITQIVLLSPSMDVNFEIEMEDYIMVRENWLKTHLQELKQRINPVPHYPALPPIVALEGQPPLVCYYGHDDSDDTVCDDPHLPKWVKVYEMPGDHHFDYNYDGLAVRMIGDLPKDAATP
ncbi:alpha/beta hydrolase [Dyella monticola]|uniref:Alpha/beta hydrolase n=1 Tax=Dyella monticola TaxID=1927958 RepID=A0A370WSS2_9GAMM|nr:AcvB/VirJ family lysyl-phosphatidylglycerol hydrolase [Dyella monticola]RDS79218.1 alpha/beta hydrolase [Dyella monticola]